jgi:small-conductance mechanosensitive channel
VTCTGAPLRWLFLASAFIAVLPALDLEARSEEVVRRILALAIPGLLGWLAIRLLRTVRGIIEHRSDISVRDNLRARRRRTRVAILYRVAVILVGVVTLCFMLMTIPSVRAVGLTLFASAGIAGLAVAAAAQPALKNLIAGMQLAFTEPIRIDDVVIIDGEWGRIEEIRLTYVVVRVWDDRRLVVPVSKFLENSFQNWTRQSAELIGVVTWHLDPTVDVPPIRDRFMELVKAHPLWDGRTAVMQVTEARADAIELRALVSAQDAGETFDLRCDIRETILAHIRDTQPEALPRKRMEWVETRESGNRPFMLPGESPGPDERRNWTPAFAGKRDGDGDGGR